MFHKFSNIIKTCLLLTGLTAGNANAELIGLWDFDGADPLSDKTGHFGDLSLYDNAFISNGELVLRDGYAIGQGYAGEDIFNKTLISWVSMTDLTASKGGSALTLDTQNNVDVFDGIVWNELNTGWISGSNNLRRGGKDKRDVTPTYVNEQQMIAITYEFMSDDSVDVALYINGQLQGIESYFQLASFSNDAEVIFGARHTFRDIVVGEFYGNIDEARIYNSKLSEDDIRVNC